MSLKNKRLRVAVPVTFTDLTEENEQGKFKAKAVTFNRIFTKHGVKMGIRPGAFKRSIDHHGGKFPICEMHDPGRVIGSGIVKAIKSQLQIDDAQIVLSTTKGRDAWELMKADIYDTISIGFTALQEDRIGDVWWTTEAKLFELTTCPRSFAVDQSAHVKELFTDDMDDSADMGFIWEETENEIRYRVREPDEFTKGSFKRIALKKDKPRVFAIVGRPEGKTTTKIQALRFPKGDDWTLSKAKKWVKEQGDFAETLQDAIILQADYEGGEILSEAELDFSCTTDTHLHSVMELTRLFKEQAKQMK